MTRLRALLCPLLMTAALGAHLPALAGETIHGPAPTAAALDATGPYAVDAFKVSAADARPYHYGRATVYYPRAPGETFGVVALMPGFLAFQAVYENLVKQIASHGFIVASLDSMGLAELPDVRARDLAGGLRHVVELANSGQAPYAGVADTSRRAVIGNSMGGGAVLSLSTTDPTLKAVVALQPWHTTQSFAADASPTLIVACEKDTIAPNKQHSDVFYASLSPALPRAEIEVRGASHLCATFLATQAQLHTMSKATVAWLKRFLDNDLRYDAMVRGGIDEGEFSRFDVQGF